MCANCAPKGQKHHRTNAFALSGRSFLYIALPRALPWAGGFWAFSPKFAGLWKIGRRLVKTWRWKQ